VKKIEAIIRPHKLDDVQNNLQEAGFSGLTVTEVKGYGRQKGHKEIYRGSEYNIEFVPKLKIELVCAANKIESAIEIIIQSGRTGEVGDGKIFVLPVEEAIRIQDRRIRCSSNLRINQKEKTMKKFILTFLAFLFGGTFFSNSLAQIEFGADLYSRYIWRGVDYGNSPSFQPALSFTAGGFTVGTWGAYSFAGEGNVFSEHDIFAQYSFETGAGTFGVIFTDYYYPSAGLEFFNYEGEGTGAHVLEDRIKLHRP
jgi:nitrogen regulatory protein P-II 1